MGIGMSFLILIKGDNMTIYTLIGNWTENMRDNGVVFQDLAKAQAKQKELNNKQVADNRAQFYYELYDENMNLVAAADVIFNMIIQKIRLVNDARLANSENVISEDDTNEEINNILTDFFLDEKQAGIDIDSFEFFESKFGDKAGLIGDAVGGFY